MAKSSRKLPHTLLVLVFGYLALVVALTLLNRLGTDRWWVTAFNLYLPQAIWAVPGVLLAIVVFRVARRWAWLPLIGALWVLGPIMGFCWPLGASGSDAAGLPLRVLTWNVKYRTQNELAHIALRYDLELHNPDLVCLQEAGGALEGTLGGYFKKGWTVRTYGEFVVASRFPLRELEIRHGAVDGGREYRFVRAEVLVGHTPVVVYDVHLESPRTGLDALTQSRREPRLLPGGARQLEQNMGRRVNQAQVLRKILAGEKGPVLVAGDLNSPDASLVGAGLREAGFHDAFAEAGKGYGYSYGHRLLKHWLPFLNLSWMRIDHIMLSPQFSARRCWTGTDRASDHRPVIADLVLRRN